MGDCSVGVFEFVRKEERNKRERLWGKQCVVCLYKNSVRQEDGQFVMQHLTPVI